MKRPAYESCFRIKTITFSIAAATLALPQVQAQEAEQLEEITVTGSRIRQTTGMTTPTPVTAVTTDELGTFVPESTIAEQLDALPQFFDTQTAQRGGGTLWGDAAGSYLNLRGMGKQRTLVLFDGSRIVPADRASSVNVDNFPTALIRSVDVVTGGASAAYGADALAGVVNFVLDREYEGMEFDASTGITEYGDGENWNISLAAGRQFGDRLHLIGSVEARELKQIDRPPESLDNFKRWGWVTNPEWTPDSPPGVPQRITRPWVHSTIHTPAGIINEPGFSLDRHTFTADGEDVRPFIEGDVSNYGGPGATNTQSGGTEATIAHMAFDGGPFGNEVVQRSGFGAIKYDLTDTFEAFAQIMAGRTESNSYNQRGNPHLQTNTWFGTVYVENAYLPEHVRQTMIEEGLDSIRIDKLGQLRGPDNENWYDNRNDKNISHMWSGTVGFDTVLPNGWDLRGTYQYGESKLTTAAYNIMRIDKFFVAMDAVRDPETGAIVCNVQLHDPTEEELRQSMEGRTVGTTIPPGTVQPPSPIGPDNVVRDCQPLNVFGHGNVSPEAQDYVVSEEKKGIRDLEQDFAEILLTGELYEGFGAGPVSFAAGLTWRDEWFNQFTRPVALERGPANAPELGIRGISDGMAGGNRSLNLFSATSVASGSFDVWEWFGELNVPVWESVNGGQRLDTNMAFRRSDYSSSGEIDSWKVGAELRLFNDLRIRATRSRDVREPTFSEQFEVGGGGGNFEDPMFDNTLFETTVLRGGNPNLAPEEADTITAGFVYQPTFAGWVDGMQLAVDWYEIDLTGAVGSLGQQRIVDECFNNGIHCDLITRDPESGIVQRILNVNLNVAAAKTSGVDFELVYQAEPDFFADQFESFSLRGFAGYLEENSTTPLGGSKQDDAGGLDRPEWTGNLTGTYNVGPYGIRVQQRYYDSTLRNVNWVEGVNVDDNTVSSQSLTNLGLSYSGETQSGSNWTTTLNVTNLFDREPPVVPSVSQRGGSQQINDNFDIFGRRYQLSFDMAF